MAGRVPLHARLYPIRFSSWTRSSRRETLNNRRKASAKTFTGSGPRMHDMLPNDMTNKQRLFVGILLVGGLLFSLCAVYWIDPQTSPEDSASVHQVSPAGMGKPAARE